MLWGLDTLVPCKRSLIEQVDATVPYQAEASSTSSAVHQQERNVLHVLLHGLPSKYSSGLLYRHECAAHAIQKGQELMNFPATKQKKKKNCVAVLQIAEVVPLSAICILFKRISAFKLRRVNIVERVSEMFCGEIPFQGSMALLKLLIRAAVKYVPL